MDTIVSFGYEDVIIKNVYYTTIGGSVITLKCLAGDDSIRDILRMNNVVEEEGRHEEKVGEEEGGHEKRLSEGIDGEVSGGVDEGDLGNITQEYLIGSKGKTRNTVEKDDEVEPLCSSDRDDEEFINLKKCARSIRRPIEGLKVPSGLQTPQGVKYKHVVKRPTPRSTPIKKPSIRSTLIKKPTTRSTPVSRGKKVASSNLAELSRLRKEKAKLAKKRDNQYENSDDVGKLRDSSNESDEENLLFVLVDIVRQRRAADVMIFAYNELRVSINYKKCVRTKKMLLKEMEGSFKDEYAMIHSFGGYLKEVNLGNSVFIKTKENDAGERVFMRMYVCLKVIKDGWKNGCKGIFGVDGCFLKGICKGVLLSAVGRDGNNQMYPITWDVVEFENNDSWTWFRQRLAYDLDLGIGHGYTMISDKHLELREVSEEAYVEMMDLLGRFWCKAFFNEGYKCDVVDNNMCEAFNSWILAAWCKAIISMIRTLIDQLMERLRERRLFAETWPNDIAPRVMKKIKENTVRYINWNYEDFVHKHYKKEKYLQAYGTALECLRGNEVLKRRPEGGCLPPMLRTPPG
ncbi:hypothetical protein SLEP1_g31566 [Rubroshorea leprosula]|uniref:MULE transposase domain-containing protein n=1 Tax=Rubroshorea leprosula TaxID=152421 RepID=A0AAV5K8X1_9ROSI|nr:hypothetical protein SLEP1_g31566 [Rubroshorea leprosula]